MAREIHLIHNITMISILTLSVNLHTGGFQAHDVYNSQTQLSLSNVNMAKEIHFIHNNNDLFTPSNFQFLVSILKQWPEVSLQE